jgi:hypothetical protein
VTQPQTVADMIDAYKAGQVTLDDLAAYVRSRTLAPRPKSSAAQMWGVEDAYVPGPDEWATIETDWRITPEEYAVLAEAHSQSLRST